MFMLREFIDRQQYSPPEEFNEYVRLMATAFDGCVNFLRDPKRFPNRTINSIADLMWQLISNRRVLVVLDQWQFPAPAFVVAGNSRSDLQIPMIVVPTNFLEQMEEDPVNQLGIIAYMASQCRDSYCGEITGDHDKSEESRERARAFEVEALLTLQKMATTEGLTLTFNDLQQQYLGKFPEGIKSLPPKLSYPTPMYSYSTHRMM